MPTILQEGLPQAKSKNGNFDDEGARFSRSNSDQHCTRFDPELCATDASCGVALARDFASGAGEP